MVTRRTLLTAALAAGLLPKASLAATRIRMGELYNHDGSFSPRADELKGTRIAMQGFMAPHLKVDSDFFILSNTPVETCPFCASEGEWIDSIVFVRMRARQEMAAPGTLILVQGTLEIGPATDPTTGFVSKVRLTDAVFQRAGA
ncbi:hypothetical protein ILT44_29035 [Microvirga sp. BT689]|jgi:hypothetical protein|uniref:hypothetical protein n=1 Tax=Microvirga arvi TaxID=2778731 RepID=UPI00194EDDAB|nr:hypothetical protein [Microvirga arvi]MBM6584245.1 hypothetical protein [Microvirga arvi]